MIREDLYKTASGEFNVLTDDVLGPEIKLNILKVNSKSAKHVQQSIATEIPFTIVANKTELATTLCTPTNLDELICGFLYSSGFINSASEIHKCRIDTKHWMAQITIKDTPDTSVLNKRLLTPGCGKGVMYANTTELSARLPIQTDISITQEQISNLSHWLQHVSPLYRSTGAIHTAALSMHGETPATSFDDIGRHNAIDKVIGKGLIDGVDFSSCMIVTSGRVSSEILHKVKRCGCPVIVARGAPTHQTVLRARDMGVTIIGFARSGSFAVYSCEERVALKTLTF